MPRHPLEWTTLGLIVFIATVAMTVSIFMARRERLMAVPVDICVWLPISSDQWHFGIPLRGIIRQPLASITSEYLGEGVDHPETIYYATVFASASPDGTSKTCQLYDLAGAADWCETVLSQPVLKRT